MESVYATSGPVKVIVLPGQSNMVGQGELYSSAGLPGTLDYMSANNPIGPSLTAPTQQLIS
jgi:hypothetical protein